METVFPAFDTINTITIYNGSQSALESARKRCLYFESIFSRFLPDSDISRINAACGKAVTVAPETSDIIRKSLHYRRITDGFFDIAAGTAFRDWDLKNGYVPDPDRSVPLPAVSDDEFHITDTSVQIPEGISLDLGGIAKGYIADDLALILNEAGVSRASINLGGNLLVLGDHPGGGQWTIGIQRPFSAVGDMCAAVTLRNGSAVTSGIYERNARIGDRIFHHIIDPHTGTSAETDLLSATICAASSTDADAVTTACLCAGSKKAVLFASRIPGARLLLILSDGTLLWYGPEEELIM